MAKLINEPIDVYRPSKHQIGAFIWRKRLYKVLEVLCWWREASSWWDNEPLRYYVRVNAKTHVVGIYELCKIRDKWYLHKVLD
jgi:hypothetical protein